MNNIVDISVVNAAINIKDGEKQNLYKLSRKLQVQYRNHIESWTLIQIYINICNSFIQYNF